MRKDSDAQINNFVPWRGCACVDTTYKAERSASDRSRSNIPLPHNRMRIPNLNTLQHCSIAKRDLIPRLHYQSRTPNIVRRKTENVPYRSDVRVRKMMLTLSQSA